MSQYIGKTISLISNKGLRYVGLLDKISAEDATVSLKSVRSFGTEGRMAEQGQPAMEVMPGTDVYEYVVFRGSDVKDLSVLDTPIEEVRPVTYYPPSGTANSPPASHTTAQNAPAVPGPTSAPSRGETAPRGNTGTHTTNSQSAASPASASPAARPAVPQETGSFQASSGGQHGHTNANVAPTPTSTSSETQLPTKTTTEQPQERSAPAPRQTTDTEYDFEEANKRFEKERQQDATNKPTYDKKSSFFDSISSNQNNGGMRWREEKDLNMDTFGEAYAHRGRGGFRGRGRGRGNGFRGRGRGNYRGRSNQEAKPEWA
ncbi:hypothetical protein OXX80_005337 [Metschnikowia pulcherrima]